MQVCDDLKEISPIAVALKFRRNVSRAASGATDNFSQLGRGGSKYAQKTVT